MAGRFPLAVGSKANNSEPWKAGRAVGTILARVPPRTVAAMRLRLVYALSVPCVRDACRLRARVFHAQRRSRHFVFDTHIKSQPARTLYDIKCVVALLIRPRKVTQLHTCMYSIGIRRQIRGVRGENDTIIVTEAVPRFLLLHSSQAHGL